MKRVKTTTAATIFFLSMISASQAAETDNHLSFQCNFDNSVKPTYAKGSSEPRSASTPEYRPGVRGKALLIGKTNGGKSGYVDYSPERNIDFEKGSISFWLKPLDWDGKTNGSLIIFHFKAGKNIFWIYKFWRDAMFSFVRGDCGKGHAPTRINERIFNWRRGEWRHVAVTWNSTEMRLFLDGTLVSSGRVKEPYENLSPSLPFGVGVKNSDESAIGESLVDELRIYDRPLKTEDIVQLYLADADNAGSSGGLITIGDKTPDETKAKGKDFNYSFTGSGFNELNGRVSPLQGTWQLSYDRDNVYVAVTSDADVDGESTDKDKQVELLIATNAVPGKLHRFRFDQSGRTLITDGTQWKPIDLKTKSDVSNKKWTLKTAIPFSVLNEKTAPDGKTWKINVARHFASPKKTVSIAPVIGRITDVNHFFKLKFNPDAPVIRFTGAMDVERGVTTLRPEVAAKNADVAVRCYTLRDEQRDSTDGMRFFEGDLFVNGKAVKRRAVKPNKLKDFEVYTITITEKSGDHETPLFHERMIYETLQPLVVQYLYTQDKKRLFVAASQNANGNMRASFIRPDESTAFEASRAIPDDCKFFDMTFNLDLDKLTPGDYKVAIDHVSPDGETKRVWTQAYRIPAPNDKMFAKYVDPEANDVPLPWTPVVYDPKGRVEMWGRLYDFSKGFLFSGLASQDEQMLLAPAKLILDGEPLTPTQSPIPKKLSADDLQVTLEKDADLGALNVKSVMTTHFDGYCEIAMTISSENKTTVKTLSLDIPLKRNLATMIRDNRICEYEETQSGAVGDNMSQDLFEGRGYFFWVGDDKVGFNWVAPSLENWHCENTEKSLEIIKEGDAAIVRLNLIDAPVKLDAPRMIKWGFTLTPTRPLDLEVLRMRSGKNFQNGIFQPWVYFAYPDYDLIKKDVVNYKASTIPDLKTLFLYMGDGLTSSYSPEWPYWEEEWRVLSGVNHRYGAKSGAKADPYVSACLGCESFSNWLTNKRAVFFERAKTPLHPKLTSYYFDSGIGASKCENDKHGCGDAKRWTDAKGNKHGYMGIDNRRELTLNTYRMIKRTGPNAWIYFHQGWLRAMPMQTFCDLMVGGEASRRDKVGNYYDYLTPELFRATFSPYVWGMKMVFIDEHIRDVNFKRIKVDLDTDNELRRSILHTYGYCLTHDVDMHRGIPQIDQIIWKNQDAIGWDENVQFHPYWVDAPAVKLISPKSDRALASAYSNNGKLLLAILNDTPKEQEVELSLDLDKLGVKKGLKGTDAWRKGKTYFLSDTFKEKVGPRDFLFIAFDKI